LKVAAIDTTVNNKPSLPTSTAALKFIPKPSPTTEAFSSQFVAPFILSLSYTLPNNMATAIPNKRASGGPIQGVKEKIANIRKMTFLLTVDNCIKPDFSFLIDSKSRLYGACPPIQ